jgi:hypothetical protein
MNINASINSGLNLALRKKEKPTFQTVFDKLDARSKKMNYCNPVNSGMTNEQMFRFYLNETEPMLHKNDDTFDLSDIMDGDIKNMKLSDFAKLLSGNLGTDVGTKYQSLPATVSEYANPTVASMLAPPPSTGTFAPPPPPPPPPIITPPPPPPSTASAPAPPPSTASAPAPPPSTASAPAPPPSTASAPAPPPSTTSAPAPPPSTASAPAPPPSTASAPAPPPSTASAPAPAPASPSALAAAATLASIPLTSASPSSTTVPIGTVITRSTSSAAASLLALSMGSPAAAGSAPASSPARGATPITFPETPESKKIKPTQIQLAADYVNALGLDPTQPLDENTNNTISTFVGFNLKMKHFTLLR